MAKRACLIITIWVLAVSRGPTDNWWSNHLWMPEHPSLWHIEGTEYVLRVPYPTTPPPTIYQSILQDPANGYEAAVDVKRISGTQSDGVGLFWRRSETRCYCLLLAGGSHYTVLDDYYGPGGREITTIVPWHLSPNLHGGDWNRIAVRAEGRDHRIILNWVEDFSFTEDKQTTGTVALTGCDSDPFEVRFRNFAFERLSARTRVHRWTLYR